MTLRPILTIALAAVSTVFSAATTQTSPPDGDRTSVMRRFEDPAPADIPGFDAALCVRTPAELADRVCKGWPADDDKDPSIVIFRGGQIADQGLSTRDLFDERFEVLGGDLDADGKDEIVVADNIGISNGTPITCDAITIVPGDGVRGRVSFEADDYRWEGSFVRRRGQRVISMFVTEWAWNLALDAGRPPGQYIVGRWFAYANGRLVPESPVVFRRFLNSFSRERGQGERGSPYRWFAGGKGRTSDRDPVLTGIRELRSSPGVITAVKTGGYERPQYIVRLNRGGEQAVPAQDDFINKNGRYISIRAGYFGLSATEVILPLGMQPTAVLGDVVGRHVRIVDYEVNGDRDEIQQIVWIDGPVTTARTGAVGKPDPTSAAASAGTSRPLR